MPPASPASTGQPAYAPAPCQRRDRAASRRSRVCSPTVNRQLASDAGLRDALFQKVYEQHESLPLNHRRLPPVEAEAQAERRRPFGSPAAQPRDRRWDISPDESGTFPPVLTPPTRDPGAPRSAPAGGEAGLKTSHLHPICRHLRVPSSVVPRSPPKSEVCGVLDIPWHSANGSSVSFTRGPV